MIFPPSVWIVGIVLIAVVGVLYKHYLHPARRRERRVLRACEKAFAEGEYRLTRIRTPPKEPSALDIAPQLFGLPDIPRYFTYNIETIEDVEPDFSDLSRREIGFVRRYLRRSPGPRIHHGKKVLRLEGKRVSLPIGDSRRRESSLESSSSRWGQL